MNILTGQNKKKTVHYVPVLEELVIFGFRFEYINYVDILVNRIFCVSK